MELDLPQVILEEDDDGGNSQNQEIIHEDDDSEMITEDNEIDIESTTTTTNIPIMRVYQNYHDDDNSKDNIGSVIEYEESEKEGSIIETNIKEEYFQEENGSMVEIVTENGKDFFLAFIKISNCLWSIDHSLESLQIQVSILFYDPQRDINETRQILIFNEFHLPHKLCRNFHIHCIRPWIPVIIKKKKC